MTSETPDLPETPPSLIEQLHAYWLGLAGGATPERAQFDPGAVKPLLPYICIVDFEDQPFRVRYRLSGSKVDEMNGFNLTGRYLDDIVRADPTGGGQHILDHYRKCWETGQPSFSSYLWPTKAGDQLGVRFAMFPLKLNGRVRQCIGIEDWEETFDPIVETIVPFSEKGGEGQ
ncbi:PAS domain-containing protein [Dongia mobilis]|uniref:PAS domain-containing protein n=1 Tax=Dongia mobilis TaxID=578943 RepID=A0A4V3DEJ9_9PROT|nr:PAS domain-containing protein [Dongia mobilis]TDQ81511.1 PAS domain-containing protein [Dongia mobilis]